MKKEVQVSNTGGLSAIEKYVWSDQNQGTDRAYFIILFISVFIFYGFSLPLKGGPHFSPSNDFSNHAHYMHSFAESFKSGQVIPRTVASPDEFSDATVKTENIPTFQYYGFFEGLVALPFQLLKIQDTIAAVLSSILIRFLGLIFLFKTCQLMGASSRTAFLASFSLLISPYTLTVFYGRGALAEVFAQSLLILIPYGYALAYRDRVYEAIFVIAMAFFLLPLCHNIFFLYGLVFLGVLTLASYQWKIVLSSGVGACLGIFLSAWQWFPAHQTISDIVIFGGLNSWKLGTSGVGIHTASLNGALGVPLPWQPAGFSQPLPLYHTIGWWTLPFTIFLLIKGIFQPKEIKAARPFLICSIVFILLTFWPFNGVIFQYVLPGVFAIVQDTSRLLGFVSILGALTLAMAIPKLKVNVFRGILILMLISQIPVFICYINLVSQKRWSNSEVQRAPINYYYINPTQNLNPLLYGSPFEGYQIKRSTGSFNPDNSFYVLRDGNKQFFVHLVGTVVAPSEFIKISIVALHKKSPSGKYEETSIRSIPALIHGDFSVVIKMNTLSPSGWYKIVLSSSKDLTRPVGSVTLMQIDVIPGNLSNIVPASSIELAKKPFAYTRQYKVKAEGVNRYIPDKAGVYILELPMAYSKLFSVKQNKKWVKFYPNFNHRMLVLTNDLSSPINVSYTLDYKVILMTFLGVVGSLLILALKRKTSRENNNENR